MEQERNLVQGIMLPRHKIYEQTHIGWVPYHTMPYLFSSLFLDHVFLWHRLRDFWKFRAARRTHISLLAPLKDTDETEYVSLRKWHESKHGKTKNENIVSQNHNANWRTCLPPKGRAVLSILLYKHSCSVAIFRAVNVTLSSEPSVELDTVCQARVDTSWPIGGYRRHNTWPLQTATTGQNWQTKKRNTHGKRQHILLLLNLSSPDNEAILGAVASNVAFLVVCSGPRIMPLPASSNGQRWPTLALHAALNYSVKKRRRQHLIITKKLPFSLFSWIPTVLSGAEKLARTKGGSMKILKAKKVWSSAENEACISSKLVSRRCSRVTFFTFLASANRRSSRRRLAKRYGIHPVNICLSTKIYKQMSFISDEYNTIPRCEHPPRPSPPVTSCSSIWSRQVWHSLVILINLWMQKKRKWTQKKTPREQ